MTREATPRPTDRIGPSVDLRTRNSDRRAQTTTANWPAAATIKPGEMLLTRQFRPAGTHQCAHADTTTQHVGCCRTVRQTRPYHGRRQKTQTSGRCSEKGHPGRGPDHPEQDTRSASIVPVGIAIRSPPGGLAASRENKLIGDGRRIHLRKIRRTTSEQKPTRDPKLHSFNKGHEAAGKSTCQDCRPYHRELGRDCFPNLLQPQNVAAGH